MSGKKGRTGKPRGTHCYLGHPLSGENLNVRADGYRMCRICQKVLQANRKRQPLTSDMHSDVRTLIQENILETPDGCWEWQGGRTRGYGMTSRFTKTTTMVHRLAYEVYVGPIPEGLQIDHLCSNPPCCNPAHLEPVTPLENQRRAWERGEHQRFNVCKKGHEFTPENTRVKKDGRRRCRICHRKTDRELKRKTFGYKGRIDVTHEVNL